MFYLACGGGQDTKSGQHRIRKLQDLGGTEHIPVIIGNIQLNMKHNSK